MKRFRPAMLPLLLFLLPPVLVKAAGKTEEHRTVTLTMGLLYPSGHPLERGIRRFAGLVEEKTGGTLEVEILDQGSWRSEPELQQEAREGRLDIIGVGLPVTAGSVAAYRLVLFPFALKSEEHLRAVIESKLAEEWERSYLEKTGLRILASNWLRPPRHLIATRPVRSLDDFRGLVLRVPQSEFFVAAWKYLGAEPVTLDFDRVYEALQGGELDAVEAPLEWMEKMSLHEQAGYVILTGHQQLASQIQINEERFRSLSEAHREALILAAREAGELASREGRELAEGLRRSLEERGVELIEIDRSRLAARVHLIAPHYEEQWGSGLWERVQALAP